MGLFFNRIKDPVEGTARVVACTPPQRGGTSRNVEMTLVVQALGVEPFSLEHRCMCRVDKWPSPGESLPVVFDREHPDRLRVSWDQVQTGSAWAQERARAVPPEMEGMLSQLQQQFPGATINVETEVVDASQNPELASQMIGMAEQAVGQDLDGDGVVGPRDGPPGPPVPPGPMTPGTPAPGGGGDPLAQLERLADLRDRGVLTEAEFQDQKAKVLGRSQGS